MTLCEPWPRFQFRDFFELKYVKTVQDGAIVTIETSSDLVICRWIHVRSRILLRLYTAGERRSLLRVGKEIALLFRAG